MIAKMIDGLLNNYNLTASHQQESKIVLDYNIICFSAISEWSYNL